MKKLNIEDFEETIEPDFHPLTNEYNISILTDTLIVNFQPETYDSNAIVTIQGNEMMIDDIGTITVTVTEEHVPSTTYTINYEKKPEVFNPEQFDYIGDEQTFVIPENGYYKLETWGAQGGSVTNVLYGGYGGYSSGIVKLKKDDILYINIGGAGVVGSSTTNGGYNGGGYANETIDCAASGGGATHIATETGLLSTFSAKKDKVLIVAGGGGGSKCYNNTSDNLASKSDYSGYGGVGGGFIGGNGIPINNVIYGYGNGGSQTQGGYVTVITDGNGATRGSFGQGASVNVYYETNKNYLHGSGGGGGYYGGGSLEHSPAGGGSGYIGNESLITLKEDEKHMTCYNCTTSNEVTTKTYTTTNVSSDPVSDHAKKGAGYAKITKVALNRNNYLLSLQANKGEWDKTFDPTVENYTVTLGVNDTKLKVSARPVSNLSVITGLGEYDIPAGTTEIPITVTAESGDERVYTITVTRPASTESKAKNITITGLIDDICKGEFPNYTNS